MCRVLRYFGLLDVLDVLTQVTRQSIDWWTLSFISQFFSAERFHRRALPNLYKRKRKASTDPAKPSTTISTSTRIAILRAKEEQMKNGTHSHPPTLPFAIRVEDILHKDPPKSSAQEEQHETQESTTKAGNQHTELMHTVSHIVSVAMDRESPSATISDNDESTTRVVEYETDEEEAMVETTRPDTAGDITQHESFTVPHIPDQSSTCAASEARWKYSKTASRRSSENLAIGPCPSVASSLTLIKTTEISSSARLRLHQRSIKWKTTIKSWSPMKLFTWFKYSFLNFVTFFHWSYSV